MAGGFDGDASTERVAQYPEPMSWWIWSPLDHARWTTVLVAMAILVITTLKTRQPHRALIATVAWLAAYEIVWQAFDVLMHPATSPTTLERYLWFVAALIAWPMLAHAIGIRPNAALVAITAGTFALWLATGFDYNWYGQPKSLQVGPEVLNVLSKTALAGAYLLGAIRPEIGYRTRIPV